MSANITYRDAQRIIAAARPSWANSAHYRFDGLPAESEGDLEFSGLRELARCGVDRGGRWAVYVVARSGIEQDCIVSHFYVDFHPEPGGQTGQED